MTSDPSAPKKDYRKTRLSGDDLSGADLSGADFTKAKLNGVNLTGANLAGAVLAGARFVDCRLVDVNLDGAKAAAAVFEQGEAAGWSAAGADFTRGIFKEFSLKGLRGDGAVFKEATFQKTTIEGWEAAGASCTGSQWVRSALVGARLVEANFDGVKAPSLRVEGSELTRCRLSRIDGLSATFADSRLVECTVVESDLAGSRWNNARVVRCDLTKSDWTTSEFKDGDVEDCTVVKTNFRYVEGLAPERMEALRAAGARTSRFLVHKAGAWLIGSRVGRVALALLIGAVIGGTYRYFTDPRFRSTDELFRDLTTREEGADSTSLDAVFDELRRRVEPTAAEAPERIIQLARLYHQFQRKDDALELMGLLDLAKANPDVVTESLVFEAQVAADSNRLDRVGDILRRVAALPIDGKTRLEAFVPILNAATPIADEAQTDALFETCFAAVADDPAGQAELQVLRTKARMDRGGGAAAGDVEALLASWDALDIPAQLDLVRVLVGAGRNDEAAKRIALLGARPDLQPNERLDLWNQKARLAEAAADEKGFFTSLDALYAETAPPENVLGVTQDLIGFLTEHQRFDWIDAAVDRARERIKDRQTVLDLRILRVTTLLHTPLSEKAKKELTELTELGDALREDEKVILAYQWLEMDDADAATRLLGAVSDPARLSVGKRHDYETYPLVIAIRGRKPTDVKAGTARILSLPGGVEPKRDALRLILSELANAGAVDDVRTVAQLGIDAFSSDPKAAYDVRYARAQALLYGPEAAESARDFDALLKTPGLRDEDRLTLLQGLSTAYRNAGRMEDSRRTLATIADEFPDQREFLLSARLEAAGAMRDAGDKDGAEKEILAVFEEATDPQMKARAANTLSFHYSDMQRLDESDRWLDEALRYAPEGSEHWVEAQAQRAGLLQRRGRFEDALALVNGLLKSPSRHHQEWLRGTRMAVLRDLRRYDDALEEGRRLLETTTDPRSRASLRLDMAGLQVLAGREEEAVGLWNELTGVEFPSDVRQQAFDRLVMHLNEHNKRGEALGAAERMTAEAGDPSTVAAGHALVARLYNEWGEQARSAAALDAIAKAPIPAPLPESVMNLASLDASDARVRDALVALFEKIEAAAKSSGEAWTYWSARLARAQWIAQGADADRARAVLNDIAENAPDPNVQVQAALASAQLATRDGKFDEARAMYDALPRRWPNREDLSYQRLIGLAEIAKQQERGEEALPLLREALDQCADEGACCHVLSEIIHHERQRQDVVAVKNVFQTMIDKYPGCWMVQEGREVLSGAAPPF